MEVLWGCVDFRKCFYHPSRWAGTLPGDVVTDASVLARAPLLALRPMLPGGTEVLAAGEAGGGVQQRQPLLQHTLHYPATSLFLTLLLTFPAKNMKQKAVQHKEAHAEYCEVSMQQI